MADKDSPDHRARHSRYWNEEWHPFLASVMSASADVRRKMQSISMRRQSAAAEPERLTTAAQAAESVEGKHVVSFKKETTVKVDVHQPREDNIQIPNNSRRVSRQPVARPVLNPLLEVSEVTESSGTKTQSSDDSKSESSECDDGNTNTEDQESSSVPERTKTSIQISEKKDGKKGSPHDECTSGDATRGGCRTAVDTHVCDVEVDAENLMRIVLRHLAQARKESLRADGDVNVASTDAIKHAVQNKPRSARTTREDTSTLEGDELSPETYAEGPPLNNATRSIYSHTLVTLRNRLVSRSFVGSSSVHDISYGDSCKAHDFSTAVKETCEASGGLQDITVIPLADKGGGEDKAKTFADVSTLCRILSPDKERELPCIRREQSTTGDRAKCSETMSEQRLAVSCAEASVFGQSRVEAMLGSYRSLAGVMEAFPVLQESPRSTKRASTKNKNAEVLSDPYHSCSEASRSKTSRKQQKRFGPGSMTTSTYATAQSTTDKRDAAFSAAELYHRTKNSVKEFLGRSYSSEVVPSAAKGASDCLGTTLSGVPDRPNRAVEYVENEYDEKPCLPKKNQRVHYIDSHDFQADTRNTTHRKYLSSSEEKSGLLEVAELSSAMKVTKKRSALKQAPPDYFDAKKKRGISCEEETTPLLQMRTKINREVPPERVATDGSSGNCKSSNFSSRLDRRSSDNSWINHRDARTKTLNLFRPVTRAELVFKNSSTLKDQLPSDRSPTDTDRDHSQEASSLQNARKAKEPAYSVRRQKETNQVLKEHPTTVTCDELLNDFPSLRRDQDSPSGTERYLDKGHVRLQPTVELASLSGLSIFNVTTFGKLQLPFGIQTGIKKDKWDYAQKRNSPTGKQDTPLPVFEVDIPVPSMTAKPLTPDLTSAFRKNLVNNVVNRVTKRGQERDIDDRDINVELTESELVRCINRLVGSDLVLPENRERIFPERNVQETPVAGTQLMADAWLHDNIVSSESLSSPNAQQGLRNCSGSKSNFRNQPLSSLRRGDIKDMLKEILEEEYSHLLHSSLQNANLTQLQPNIRGPPSRKTSSCPSQSQNTTTSSSTSSHKTSVSSPDSDSSSLTDSSEEVISCPKNLCAEPHLLDARIGDSSLDRTSGTLKEGGDGLSSRASVTETSPSSTSITSSSTSIEHAHPVPEHDKGKRTSQLFSDITVESSSMSKPTATALPFASFVDSQRRLEASNKHVAFGAVKTPKVSRPPVYAAEVWNVTELSSSFPGGRAVFPERAVTGAHLSLSLSSASVYNHPEKGNERSRAPKKSNSAFALPFQRPPYPPLHLQRSISETHVELIGHQALHPEKPIFNAQPISTHKEGNYTAVSGAASFRLRPKSASFHGFSYRHDISNYKKLIQQSKAKSYTQFWLKTVSLFQEATSDQLTSSSDAGLPLAFSDTTTIFDLAQMEAFEKAAMERQRLTALADKYNDANPLLEAFLRAQATTKETPKPPLLNSKSLNTDSFVSRGLKVDKEKTRQHDNIIARAPSTSYEPFTLVPQDCPLAVANVTSTASNDLDHRSFREQSTCYTRSKGRTDKLPYVVPRKASCQHEENANNYWAPTLSANCSTRKPKRYTKAPPLEVQASYEDSSVSSPSNPKKVKTFRKKAPYRTPFPLCSTSRSSAPSRLSSKVLKMNWDKTTTAQTSVPGCFKMASVHGTVPPGNVIGQRLARSETIVMSQDLQVQPQRSLSALANLESSYLWNHRTRYCEDWLNSGNAYAPGRMMEAVPTVQGSPTTFPLENSEEVESGSSTEYYEAS